MKTAAKKVNCWILVVFLFFQSGKILRVQKAHYVSWFGHEHFACCCDNPPGMFSGCGHFWAQIVADDPKDPLISWSAELPITVVKP